MKMNDLVRQAVSVAVGHAIVDAVRDPRLQISVEDGPGFTSVTAIGHTNPPSLCPACRQSNWLVWNGGDFMLSECRVCGAVKSVVWDGQAWIQ